jgi:serine/threonine-protein phosphatase 6 regulatory subunit 3
VCFKLFARYPFNNFLHHHVESMVMAILEWGHVELVAHLLAGAITRSLFSST